MSKNRDSFKYVYSFPGAQIPKLIYSWIDEGDTFDHYNWDTNQIETWVATKDLKTLENLHEEYELRKEQEMATKEITAQTNFQWLNRQ